MQDEILPRRMDSKIGPRVLFDGREFDYFGGSGYLGLQTHPDVLQAAHMALERYGLSNATSRGGFGEHPVYDELEREACAFFGAQKTIHLPSGYLGAAVLTQASGQLFEHIFIDASAHFSLWDAAHLSNQPITAFTHLRAQAAADALRSELRPGERPLLLTDGVFPISGEIAPLPEYLQIIADYGGLIFVDDAHAAGVLGPNGRGTPDYYNITSGTVHASATLAKALGGSGGVLWGEADWIERIERASRICAGASPPPLVTAAASARALARARVQPELREQLWQNVARMKNGLRGLGFDLADTPVPILCLRGDQGQGGVSLERIRAGLYQRGIAVELVRSYTSAPPGGGLRIAVFAQHSAEQIDRLVEEIKQLC